MARGPIPPSNNGWSNRANGNGGPRRPREADRSDRPVLPSVNEILSGDYMPSRFSRTPYAVNPPPAVPTPEGYEDRPESPPAYSYASIPDNHQQRPLAPMQDDRSSQVPRRYGSQQQAPLSPRSNPSSWASPPRTPPAPRLPSFPPIRESVPMEPYDHFVPSPSRPRPHEMNYERAPEAMSRMSVAWPETRHAEGGDYYRAPPSSGAAHGRPSQPQPREPREFYRLPPLPYRPHHEPTHHARPYPTRRHHSFSFSRATYWDRRPLFPEDEYSPAHSNYMREPNGESRPKRRRGNLPRESTDRLRAWFDAHQEHPYPSEEVKQALMRETGLQMNQISNWFINARRRYLKKPLRPGPDGASDASFPSPTERNRNASFSDSEGSLYASEPLTAGANGISDPRTAPPPLVPPGAVDERSLSRTNGFGRQSV